MGDERHVLEWEQVAGSLMTSRIMLIDGSVESVTDVITDSLVHTIRGFVLAGAPTDVTASVTVVDPRSHWQRLLWTLTTEASTRPGRWLEGKVYDWLPRRTETNKRTVNRNICPHGVVARTPHQSHLEWLSVDRPFP